jgi:hypothetical protein
MSSRVGDLGSSSLITFPGYSVQAVPGDSFHLMEICSPTQTKVLTGKFYWSVVFERLETTPKLSQKFNHSDIGMPSCNRENSDAIFAQVLGNQNKELFPVIFSVE